MTVADRGEQEGRYGTSIVYYTEPSDACCTLFGMPTGTPTDMPTGVSNEAPRLSTGMPMGADGHADGRADGHAHGRPRFVHGHTQGAHRRAH